MKKLINAMFIVVTAGLLFLSCDDRHDENVIQSVDAIKIDSVKIAQDTMDVFTVQSIKTYSTYPDGCHGFYGYDYIREDMTRKVVSYAYKVNGNCTQATHTDASIINFRPEQTGTYTFKFWNGKDSSNNNIWIEKTIVVE